MTDTLDVTAFEQTQRETAIWCEVEGPRSQFRTAALRPSLTDWPTSEELAGAVEALIRGRRELLATYSLIEPPTGRLLICEVNGSVSSGESEVATSGFFDIDDRPPWDTWIWNVPRTKESGEATLLSWVPLSLVQIVNRGIETNPYGCIYWLADAPRLLAASPLVRALSAAGIR